MRAAMAMLNEDQLMELVARTVVAALSGANAAGEGTGIEQLGDSAARPSPTWAS